MPLPDTSPVLQCLPSDRQSAVCGEGGSAGRRSGGLAEARVRIRAGRVRSTTCARLPITPVSPGPPSWGSITSTRNVPYRCAGQDGAEQRQEPTNQDRDPISTSAAPRAGKNHVRSSRGTVRPTRSATGVVPATLSAPNQTNTTPSITRSSRRLNRLDASRASALRILRASLEGGADVSGVDGEVAAVTADFDWMS